MKRPIKRTAEPIMNPDTDLFIGIKSWFEDGTDSVQLFHAHSNAVYGEFAVNSPKMPKQVLIYNTVSELNNALDLFRRKEA